MKYISCALVMGALLFILTPCHGQKTKDVKATVGLSNDGHVVIDTYKGTITIVTWDKPLVNIAATIEADGGEDDAEENVRNTEIAIDSTSSGVRIKSDYDRLHSRSRKSIFGMFENNSIVLPFVHYSITMPKKAHLRIKDYKSDSKITNLSSTIDLETYKGKVVISGLEGSLDLTTYKGEVSVEFLRLTGNSSLETGKGRIDLTLPKNAGFDLDADMGRKASLSSDFELTSSGRNGLRNRDDSFRGAINGGGPRLRLRSDNGDIRLIGK